MLLGQRGPFAVPVFVLVTTLLCWGWVASLRYISPDVMTPEAWDVVATASKWARANEDTLVHSQWVGGSPVEMQIYGFGSWSASTRKMIIMLRNPNAK